MTNVRTEKTVREIKRTALIPPPECPHDFAVETASSFADRLSVTYLCHLCGARQTAIDGRLAGSDRDDLAPAVGIGHAVLIEIVVVGLAAIIYFVMR